MKKLLLGIVALAVLALGGPATAADLPYKAAPPMVAPPSTWTGIYGGVALGAKMAKGDWTTTCFDPFLFACGSAANALLHPIDSSANFSTTGFRAGGYFGANWQVLPSWVIGVEGDVAWSSQTATTAGVIGCLTVAAPFTCGGAVGVPGLTTAGDSTSVKIGNDASARGRLGFLVTPDWLVYGTGGAAFQEISATVSCGTLSPLCFGAPGSSTQKTTLMGYTVGGGLEWKFMRNWLIRGEYRFADFGHWRPEFTPGLATNMFTDIHVRTHIATFGLAYLFPAQ